MILLFLALALVAALLVWRRRPAAPSTAGKGWRWFAGWSVAGALFTFSVLTGFSIGLFIMPVAAVLLILVAWNSPRSTEALGFINGIGVPLLLVAFLNRDFTPCPTDGIIYLPAGSPPGSSASCGGLDPVPWLITGIVVSALALLSYAALRRRNRSLPPPV